MKGLTFVHCTPIMIESIESPSCFIPFTFPKGAYTLPERFTFPFQYIPHPLCERAAEAVQAYLDETNIAHDFGLEDASKGKPTGKMFGVLVVQNQQGELGYLRAFSGRLANSYHQPNFVPPVVDLLQPDGFFRQGERQIDALSAQILALESSTAYQSTKAHYEEITKQIQEELKQAKFALKQAKAIRDEKRLVSRGSLSDTAYEDLKRSLEKESLVIRMDFKRLRKSSKERLAEEQQKFEFFSLKLERLKTERRERSAQLQNQLFDQFTFLNQAGKQKSLKDIFGKIQPPAAAGECAAPKLLHYAFLHQLKPIAMAEFWYGAASPSQIRQHGQYYPACRGKCEPILGHMLEGMELDPHPLLEHFHTPGPLEIAFEDEHLLLVKKPAKFLSVPGKKVRDSVLWRMQQSYPEATGPLLVHRLDFATSGLLLVAKKKEVHQALQYQFYKRSIEKRYVAILEGHLKEKGGTIDLPLRVDLDNRPRQLVCYEHGKTARTHWELLDQGEGQSRVHFFPVTGRTHQLRVHAAHPLGLGVSIKGDILYGHPADRLYLHAEGLSFIHPIRQKVMEFEWKAPF